MHWNINVITTPPIKKFLSYIVASTSSRIDENKWDFQPRKISNSPCDGGGGPNGPRSEGNMQKQGRWEKSCRVWTDGKWLKKTFPIWHYPVQESVRWSKYKFWFSHLTDSCKGRRQMGKCTTKVVQSDGSFQTAPSTATGRFYQNSIAPLQVWRTCPTFL